MAIGRVALWVAFLSVCVAMPARVAADDLLYDCYGNAGTDSVSCGFYIENFQGSTVNTVALSYATNGAVGTYQMRLTARLGAFDGPVIATDELSFNEGGGLYYFGLQNAAIAPLATIAFVQTIVNAPPDGQVFFGVGPCAPGDTGCESCPGIVETVDTTPPLSTFRRASVRLSIWGQSLTPIAPDSWGTLKALYRY